jgi:hypothetical protein
MGAVTLSDQSFLTVEQALLYLQDQGTPHDDQDTLRLHMNAVAGHMVKLTGRNRLIYVENDNITEYRDGMGTTRLQLRNAPVKALVSITLNPHESTSVAVTVPTGGATFSDDCFFDAVAGLVVLKSRLFPEGASTVKIVYTAGFETGSPEFDELKMIAANILARRWARWKGQRHGVSSESRGDNTISFVPDDITKTEIRDLRRYRRILFS